MDRSKRKAINRLAELILRELELSPPVDVEKAAEMLGGEIKQSEPGGDIEAMVEKNGEGFIIRLDYASIDTRQGFPLPMNLGICSFIWGIFLQVIAGNSPRNIGTVSGIVMGFRRRSMRLTNLPGLS